MQTLGEMIGRVLRIESQESTTDTNTRLAVRDAINEAYRILCTTYFWNWLSTSTTVATAVDDTHLTLPTDFIALLQLEDSAEVVLDPRTLERQLEFASSIASKGLRTYAVDGVDGTGQMRLRLEPASTGETYTLYYLAMPAELSADADLPIGPMGVDDFLVRHARLIRAEDDEEQNPVVGVAERRSLEALSRLARTSGQPLRQLTGAIMPLRG